MAEEFFTQLIIMLTLSLVTAMVFRRLKMATLIAYICVGVAIGPFGFGVVSQPDQFALVAEFGVVFLLFTLGLEFSLSKMLAMKFMIFGVGSIQVLACTLVFSAAVFIWGASMETSILIAGALALSSTAVVTKELSNNHQLNSQYGRMSVGVLLFQDLAAIVFLILVPVLADSGNGHSLGSELLSALGRGIVLFAILLVIGKWALPVIYHEVSRSQSQEIFVLSTLVIALLAGWLTHEFHLSMALGGFVTGVMLGEGPFRYQIEKDIQPFKDILMGLFFVSIGMALEFQLLLEYWPRIIAFTLALIVIKTVVVTLVIRVMNFHRQDALKVGLTLAQAGEFGIALMALANTKGVVAGEQTSFIILIAIFSMALSPLLIRHSGYLVQWLFRDDLKTLKEGSHKPLQNYEMGHVIIGGYGRVGSTLATLLERNHIPYIAIDNNIENVIQSRSGQSNVVYGDCSHLEILERCHLREARLAVLTIKSLQKAKAILTEIRSRHIDTPIIVRCYGSEGIEELISQGANHVFPEVLESSLMISSQALRMLDVNEKTICEQIEAYRFDVVKD